MATNDESAIVTANAEFQGNNMEVKILDILHDAYPNLDCGPGTPIYEMVVRPMAMLWQRQSDGVVELLEATNLANYANMPEVDLDNLLEKFFVYRRRGTYVTGVVRVYFAEPAAIAINAGDIVTADNNRVYEVISDHFVTKAELKGDADSGYYIDIAVKSLGLGSAYNASAGDSVEIACSSSSLITKAYFIIDSSDGGVSESNYVFFNRAKDQMSTRNMFAFRPIKATLYENFDTLREIIPIGIKDDEMIRDIYPIPGYGNIHLGGKCDIYVHPYSFEIANGYKAPLGFPLAFRGYTLADTPENLLVEWNSAGYDVDADNRGVRSSSKEIIRNLETGVSDSLRTLTYDLSKITDFIEDGSRSALHTDNLVKLVYPVVFTATIRVTASSTADVGIVKATVAAYINALQSTDYPRVAELVRLIMDATNVIVRIDANENLMNMRAYYLNEYAEMEYIGLNYERSSATSLFEPLEPDSLKFRVGSLSQISLKTCCWYTNEDLIKVEVVN